MIHIYTFCDKTLVGKKSNSSAMFLCESLFKLNFKISDVCIYCNNYDYENITFKNNDIYFLLLQKSNSKLNSVLANLYGCELKDNENLKQVVLDYFKDLNIPMDKGSELEWVIPHKATAITNPNGKTQGYFIKIADSHIFVLPNNFNEFKTIFNDCLLDYIETNFVIEYKSETYKTFGLTEQYIYEILKDLIKNKDKVFISVFSKGLDNDIVIKAKINNEKFEEYRLNVFNKLEKFIYSVQNLSMDEYLNKSLVDSDIKISIIGDITSSKILSELEANVLKNNISEIISLPSKNSIVNYGVSEEIIDNFGEISAEVAYNLAVKSIEHNDSDLALSCLVDINSQNIGTSYIAIGNKVKIDVYKNTVLGDAKTILSNTVMTAKFYLIKKLMAKDFKVLK